MDGGYRRTGAWLLAGALLCVPAKLGAGEEHVGSEACAACHEDVVTAFAKTAHAIAPGWDAESGCESCHGPGSTHAEDLEVDAIVRPQELQAQESSKICLDCHKRQESHFSYKQSLHRIGDVACIDCHNPHSTAEKMLEASGKELCASCHQAISAQFDLPRAHPIDDCSNCHEPHATKALRTSRSLFGETCGGCHFEKTQPFIYNHDTLLVDGCAACHEVHGSPNRHLLKHEPQVNLCYQCHSAAVTPTWHSAQRFLNEKCTACHTAIHGSNTSPFFLEE